MSIPLSWQGTGQRSCSVRFSRHDGRSAGGSLMWQWLRSLFGGGPKGGQPSVASQVRDARSQNPGTREVAAVRLGERSEPESAPALLDLLRDTHTPVREAALASLRRLGQAISPSLRQGLGHPEPGVAQVCADLLGELNDPEAIE